MIELKDCPYCGQKDILVQEFYGHASTCKERSPKVIEGFIVEANHTLENYKGMSNVREILSQIQDDLNVVLNKYVSENYMVEKDFPIHFYNEYGDFYVHSDGETTWIPKTAIESITTSFTLLPLDAIFDDWE